MRHSVAEEEYLGPAVREHVAGGDALADREIDDHSEAERIMKDMEGCDATIPGSTGWSGCGASGEEAGTDPPAPVRTRPHPSAPDEPPANSCWLREPAWSTDCATPGRPIARRADRGKKG